MNLRIVTVGGGSGTPIVNEALLLAGAKNIDSVVTVMDSGGITGRMRTDSAGQQIAYSDSLRTLLSLISPKIAKTPRVKSLKELFLKRNDRGQVGYTIFSHYFSPETGFAQIQELLETLADIKFCGRVIPVTTQPCDLVFETKSGQVYRGEHELDDKRMSADTVTQMWLDPEVTAYVEAIDAIASADLIIFCCGSLHGSILINLLPKGIKQALRISHARKFLLTNLASSKNETDNFTPEDFVKIFQKYSGMDDPLDYLIVPNISREKFEKKYPDVAERYALEHSHFLGWEKTTVPFLAHDATTIDPVLKRLRHDPKKLAKLFKQLLTR